jgi:hypothetical protein
VFVLDSPSLYSDEWSLFVTTDYDPLLQKFTANRLVAKDR